MPITLCCLLWATPNNRPALHVYEDAVLGLLLDHGARIVHRALGDGSDGTPDEVQFYQTGLDGYLADPRRIALAEERERVIDRTQLFPVTFVSRRDARELT